ncbi:MAG: hypothetical protein NTX33_04130 [Propionibacteriales bacterium]|nr:hypothetical protein [Propionibacteriales bacterium]
MNSENGPAVTEGEARRLLSRAADTIQVEADAPLHLTGFPEPTHLRRWPLVLAAAVAVVALVGGGLAAGAMLGRDGDAAPADQQSATDRTSGSAVVPSATDVSSAAPVPPTAPRRAAAEQFVRWARGTDPAPPFADRVRNLTPGFVDPWNDEPQRRDRWSGCSGLGFPDCGIDPVAMAYRSRGSVEVASCPVSCHDERLASGEDAVVVSQPDGDQGPWAVLLWIDAAGEIYAVGLGTPT